MRCHKTERFGIVDGMTARQINAVNVVEQFLPAPSSKASLSLQLCMVMPEIDMVMKCF